VSEVEDPFLSHHHSENPTPTNTTTIPTSANGTSELHIPHHPWNTHRILSSSCSSIDDRYTEVIHRDTDADVHPHPKLIARRKTSSLRRRGMMGMRRRRGGVMGVDASAPGSATSDDDGSWDVVRVVAVMTVMTLMTVSVSVI